MSYKEPNDPQSIHFRCKLICTCLWLNVNKNEWSLLHHVTDTQIGLLDEKDSLAVIENSTFDAYNSILTNLMLYLINVNSHDFSRISTLLCSVVPSS